jgi:thioredoxin 1
MSVIKVNQSNFDEILASEKPVLLDFYADWCGPCRMVAPVVEEIALEHPEYVVGKINVDESPELAQKYGVFSIPTLAVVKEGRVAGRMTGAKPKEKILELFN